MRNGKIGVTTENIFPVIKKFLYSDHEIFLRELVSNAVDATQKLKTLSSKGEFQGTLGDLTIHISADQDKKTLTIRDRGIGMTAEEIDRYINQIAFSGAEEFLAKYKDQSIIGHFGLGFYSSFMVADRVEIFTQSYKEDAPSVHWMCDGSPEYEMEELSEKRERGTEIVLHLSDDCKEYCEEQKVEELLKKYCHFLPVEIAFGKVKEWKDGKYVATDKDNIINNVEPLWTRKPTEITEEQYKAFYSELYPMSDEPLFNIHMNIDYPFNLTGILYFPKINNNIELQKNKIQLYCNQVFVTDQVEGIVPEYLTLLHGVIDSPDIPLNVSRSYLQSDAAVKKISGYITKKVSSRLEEIFKSDRDEYQKKWDDIKLFIQFGMLSDEKFYDRTIGCALLKNLDGKYFTLEEYKEHVKDNQTDKHGDLIMLYAQDPDASYSYIERAKAKGYDVLLMDGELDVHAMSQFEQKAAGEQGDAKNTLRFVRVDSDVIENLISKENKNAVALTSEQEDALRYTFESVLPNNDKDNKVNYSVSFESVSEDALPVFLTQNEFMRRMKEMSVHQQGMSFYGQMPDHYNVVINTANPKVTALMQQIMDACAQEVLPLQEQLAAKQAEEEQLKNEQKDIKEQDLTQEQKDAVTTITKDLAALKQQIKHAYAQHAKNEDKVSQLIDIALLASGMLKGEALAKFVNRSVDLL